MRKLFGAAMLLATFCALAPRAKAQDTISLTCFQDPYAGGTADFSLTIDGKSVSASTPCPASSTAIGVAPAVQTSVSFTGSWGGTSTAHKIVVTFINDAWTSPGGYGKDRNLYVTKLTFDGSTTTNPSFSQCGGAPITTQPTAALLCTNDAATYSFAAVAPPVPPRPPTGTTSNSLPFTLVCNTTGSVNLGVATISCTNTGTVHAASLAWVASTSAGVDGYNIYRSLVSGGSYSKVGATTGAVTFVDSTVASGQTYYYVVTAVAPACPPSGTSTAACGESAYSNQAQAIIP